MFQNSYALLKHFCHPPKCARTIPFNGYGVIYAVLFNGLAILNGLDRFIPRNMHLALCRMCDEWCQLGTQSETVKHRLILMQRASAAATGDPLAELESSVEVFRHETKLLSNAAAGALASLCVSLLPNTSSLLNHCQ